MKIIATISLIIAFIIPTTACVKVRRSFNVTVPGGTSAADRAQSGIFEMRNGLLVAVDQTIIDEFTAALKAEFSGKDIVDDKQKPEAPVPFLGAKLSTSIAKVVTNACIQDIQVKAAGSGAMTININLQSCGLVIRVVNAKAIIQFDSVSQLKPFKLTVDEFRLKDEKSARNLTFSVLLKIDALGALVMDGNPKFAGADIFADPNIYDFKVDTTDMDGAAAKLKKTHDELIAMTVSALLKGTKGYLESRFNDAMVRTMTKYREKLSERQLGLGGKSFTMKFLNLEFFNLVKLRGFFGEKNLGLALESRVQVLPQTSPNPSDVCTINSFDEFPDPIAAPLGSQTLVQTLKDFKSLDPAVANSPANIHGSGALPLQLLNFMLWRTMGKTGSCHWPIVIADQPFDLVVQYKNPPILSVTEAAVSTNSQGTGSIISVNFPDLTIAIPIALRQKIEELLRKEKFFDDTETLLLPSLTLDRLTYQLAISPFQDSQSQGVRVSVLNEDLYLQRTRINAEDILSDMNRSLKGRMEILRLNLNEKRRFVTQEILTSVLNSHLAKILQEQMIKVTQEQESKDLLAESVALKQDAAFVTWTAATGSPSPPQAQMLSAANNITQTLLFTKDLATDTDLSRKKILDVLTQLNYPFAIKSANAEGLSHITDVLASSNLPCKVLPAVRAAQNTTQSATDTYLHCGNRSYTLEIKVHAEEPNDHKDKDANLIFYQSLDLVREPSSTSVNVLPLSDYARFESALAHAQDNQQTGRWFRSTWSAEGLNVRLSGICKTITDPCATEDKLLTQIEVWE